jgi:hypothetical protein
VKYTPRKRVFFFTNDTHCVNLVGLKSKEKNMFKTPKLLMLAVLALFITACAAPSKRESMGEYLDSTAVTANVKARLVDRLGSSGFTVQVKTYKDDVQLSGFVSSAYLKKRAGAIAANTAGVRQVRNDLIIK